MLKLNTPVLDSAANIKGTLTHMQHLMGGNVFYCFEPSGIAKETGLPKKSYWVPEDRIEKGEVCNDDNDLPYEILGSVVTEKNSGISGIATSLTLHINGCVHVLVQPEGCHPKTGEVMESIDFDVRRLTGAKIPKLTEKQRKESQKKKPSPASTPPLFKR